RPARAALRRLKVHEELDRSPGFNRSHASRQPGGSAPLRHAACRSTEPLQSLAWDLDSMAPSTYLHFRKCEIRALLVLEPLDGLRRSHGNAYILSSKAMGGLGQSGARHLVVRLAVGPTGDGRGDDRDAECDARR